MALATELDTDTPTGSTSDASLSFQSPEGDGASRRSAPGSLTGGALFLLAGALGAAFWVVDSLVDSVVLGHHAFRDELLALDAHTIYMRSLVVLSLIILAGIAAILQTKRRDAEQRHQRSEARMRAILSNAPIVLFTTDLGGTITFSEGKGLDTAGLRAEDLVGHSVFELFQDHPNIGENIRRALEGETFTTRVDIGDAIFEVQYGPDSTGSGVIGIAAEVTARVRAEEALEQALETAEWQARSDLLTGSLNHGAITAAVSELCASSEADSAAVLMVDLIGMKATNDTYGHQLGDEILKALAQTLARTGAIAGRYGGDEFLVILPNADRAKAERYRAEVQDALRDLEVVSEVAGHVVAVTASLGIAMFPEDSRTPDELIRVADRAMYASRGRRLTERMNDGQAA